MRVCDMQHSLSAAISSTDKMIPATRMENMGMAVPNPTSLYEFSTSSGFFGHDREIRPFRIPPVCSFTKLEFIQEISDLAEIILIKLINQLHSLWNPEVHCHIHKVSPIIPILSQINTIPRIGTYLFKVHSNIVLPSMPRSP